jgi:hypothetical protein
MASHHARGETTAVGSLGPDIHGQLRLLMAGVFGAHRNDSFRQQRFSGKPVLYRAAGAWPRVVAATGWG